MKELISILLTAVMISTQTAFAVEYGEELKNTPTRKYSQTFTDVTENHWAFSYIGELVSDGVLEGYMDGKFRPENNVTRAEFAKIMVTAAGLKTTTAQATTFEDVSLTDWYSPYIETAKDFLTGYNYGGSAMYLPNKAALREDIAVALVKLKGYDVSIADLGMLQVMFSDYDSISESAKRYVAVAVERGLVSGYNDGTFKGQQSITRAEAAALIWRANQYGSDNKIMGSETTSVPTEAPTIKPTSIPTAKPTLEPTVMPTTAPPTLEPTIEPTAEPTATPIPQKKYIAKVLRNKTPFDYYYARDRIVVADNDIIYLNNEGDICKMDVLNDEYEVVLDIADWVEENANDGLDNSKNTAYDTIYGQINGGYNLEISSMYYDEDNCEIYFIIKGRNSYYSRTSVICKLDSKYSVSTVYDSGRYREWGGNGIGANKILGVDEKGIYFQDSYRDSYCYEFDSGELYNFSYSKNNSVGSSITLTSSMTVYKDKIYQLKSKDILVYDKDSGECINDERWDIDEATTENISCVEKNRNFEYPLIIDENNIVIYNANNNFVLIYKNPEYVE